MARPDEPIKQLRGAHGFLSNFHPSPLEYEGITYPTAEHAYQAAKTTNLTERAAIAALKTPGGAKKAGHKVTLRPAWDEMRVAVMEEICYRKFTQNPELGERLLSTGDAIIEEHNWWGDTWWGICDGIGQNHLGMVLMRVRRRLRNETAK